MDGGLVVHYLSLDNVWPLKGSSYLSQGLKTAMAICAIISRLKSSPAGGRGGGRRRLTWGWGVVLHDTAGFGRDPIPNKDRASIGNTDTIEMNHQMAKSE